MLSEENFIILKRAVDIARNDQIKRLSTLRAKLLNEFPGKEEGIRQALEYWGKQVKQSHSRSPQRY